jgi:nucleoside-diphosphate-sugar epimerase
VTKGFLITGGTGFLGQALLHKLLVPGQRPLIAAVRRYKTDFPAEVRVEWVNELGSSTDWSACLRQVGVVIHCAARAHVMKEETGDPLLEYRRVNVQGTLHLAEQAVKAGVRRFVYISSIKVNGEHTALNIPFHAEDIPAPEDAYGISKLEAEQGLLALARNTGMEVVIIRPPLVYGPGVKGNFASMVRWVRNGVPLPLGAVHNRRSLVAMENLVDFIALCADPERSPRATNEVFLISDGEDVSTTELLRRVANAYNAAPRLLPIPASWIQTASRLLGKHAVADRLLGSLVVDSSKARDLLDWKPVVSIDEQLKMMALHDTRT